MREFKKINGLYGGSLASRLAPFLRLEGLKSIFSWRKIKEGVTKHRSLLVDLLIILLLGTLSFGWFQEGMLINGEDFDFPLYPRETLRNYFYIWNPNISLGGTLELAIPQIPYQFFLALLSFFGLSPQAIERILFFTIFVVFGLSMYYLCSVLFKGEKKRIICLVAAAAYMMNPFARTFIWRLMYLHFFVQAILPLFLALFIQLLRSKRIKYLVLFCILSVVTASASSLAMIIILWGIILSYFIFYVIVNHSDKGKLVSAFKLSAVLVMVWLMVNMWWILPIFSSASEVYEFTLQKEIGMSNIDVLNISSRDTSFLNVFRLRGFWALRGGFLGDMYYTWAEKHESPLFVLISFIVPLFAFVPLLFLRNRMERERYHHVVYFSAVTVIGLFLLKGSHPPLGRVFIWAFEKIPFMSGFRNHYDKFGIIVVLGYALLFATAMSYLYHAMKNRSKWLAVGFLMIVLVLVFIVQEGPFWTGEVIYAGGEVIPSWHVKVPDYYPEARQWLHTQSPFYRIYPLPLPNIYGTAYQWESGYRGQDLGMFLFPQPTIARKVDELSRTIEQRILHRERMLPLARLLGLLNVRHILLHNDAHFQYLQIDNPSAYQEALLGQPNIVLQNSFGRLDFYENKLALPRLYATEVPTLVDGGQRNLIDLATLGYLDGYPLIIFADEALIRKPLTFLSTQVSKVIEVYPHRLRGQNFNKK